MKQPNLTSVAAVASMVPVLLAAYGLNQWVARAQAQAVAAFAVATAVRITVLANLILAHLWLGLVWLVLARIRPGRPVAIWYLAVGILLAAAPALSVSGWLPAAFLEVVTPTSYVSMTGGRAASIKCALARSYTQVSKQLNIS